MEGREYQAKLSQGALNDHLQEEILALTEKAGYASSELMRRPWALDLRPFIPFRFMIRREKETAWNACVYVYIAIYMYMCIF